MSAEASRAAMVERLRAAGRLVTPAVEAALMTVPRHHFIQGASADASYADAAIAVKRTEDGTAISSLSQPSIVAAMLELSCLEPGHRVLEIGTGTGYNAALLATLVGSAGRVVTIELEDDLAMAAQERLHDHGFSQVEVVIGDGAVGYQEASPYDRVVVTTGASEVAPTWRDQLRDGGRLVVPVVNSEGIGTVRCLVRRNAQLEEISRLPCGFLPMRAG